MNQRHWSELGLFYCSLVWGSTFFIVKGLVAEVHPVALVGVRLQVIVIQCLVNKACVSFSFLVIKALFLLPVVFFQRLR